MRYIFILSAVLFWFSLIQLKAQEPVRYIFVNTMPGRHWKVSKPQTFTRALFVDVIKRTGVPENKKIRIGVSCIFDFLSTNLDSVAKSLDKFLALSKETKVPILIHLDGANWLNGRPDLWNWWDKSKPGYNPANCKNVEWTGWDESTAIKISWRNWGKQLRVLPAPNIASPAFIEANINALKRLIPQIVQWYKALPQNEKYLLGGVKLAHEASIGVNAYYYKNGNRYLEQMSHSTSLDPKESYNPAAGFTGGLAQLGYAAVKTSGIKKSGIITIRDIEKVVYEYLDTLCITVGNLGLPMDKIFTHQGGTYAPWEKHLSYGVGSNEHSLPGYSFYSVSPDTAGDLGKILDSRNISGWAAPEWWCPGRNKNEWVNNIWKTLSYKDCRFLAIFNWESLDNYPDGIAAIKEVVTKWK